MEKEPNKVWMNLLVITSRQKKVINSGNSPNSTFSKKIKTESLGDLVLNIPRDRNSDYSPGRIPKVQHMSDKLEEAIIGMYCRGMTTSDVSEQVKNVYGVEVSEGTISNVTARIIEHAKEWQARSMEPVYYVVWMDGIVLKIKQRIVVPTVC